MSVAKNPKNRHTKIPPVLAVFSGVATLLCSILLILAVSGVFRTDARPNTGRTKESPAAYAQSEATGAPAEAQARDKAGEALTVPASEASGSGSTELSVELPFLQTVRYQLRFLMDSMREQLQEP